MYCVVYLPANKPLGQQAAAGWPGGHNRTRAPNPQNMEELPPAELRHRAGPGPVDDARSRIPQDVARMDRHQTGTGRAPPGGRAALTPLGRTAGHLHTSHTSWGKSQRSLPGNASPTNVGYTLLLLVMMIDVYHGETA